LRHILILLPVLGLAAACTYDGDEHSTDATPAEMFAKYCETCHNDKGQGRFLMGFPPTNDTNLSKEQITLLIMQGSTGEHSMPGFPGMSREDAEILAAYVIETQIPK